MKNWLALTVATATLGTAATAVAEKLTLREISTRTFSGTLNDEEDHPVLIIDDLKSPKPIGPGRGAGGYVFLNNKLLDWETGKEVGTMRGMCFVVDHGPAGPWKGEMRIGAGGPFPSACQLNYELAGGQLVGSGIIDLNAMELDKPLLMPILGGTGKYKGARGELMVVQDPPGQPITYKVVLDFKLR